MYSFKELNMRLCSALLGGKERMSLKKFFMPFSHSLLYISVAVIIFSSLNIPSSNYCHTIKKTFRMEKPFVRVAF